MVRGGKQAERAMAVVAWVEGSSRGSRWAGKEAKGSTRGGCVEAGNEVKWARSGGCRMGERSV
jgi:hypothetical protein